MFLIESPSRLARGADMGESGRGNVQSSAVRVRDGVTWDSIGLRDVSVRWRLLALRRRYRRESEYSRNWLSLRCCCCCYCSGGGDGVV